MHQRSIANDVYPCDFTKSKCQVGVSDKMRNPFVLSVLTMRELKDPVLDCTFIVLPINPLLTSTIELCCMKLTTPKPPDH